MLPIHKPNSIMWFIFYVFESGGDMNMNKELKQGGDVCVGQLGRAESAKFT